MIVVDASALIEALLHRPDAADLEHRLSAAVEIHAPYLLDVEVMQVLRRYAAKERISAARGQELLSDLLAFPIERHPHDLLLPRIWALRRNLTAYDAAYVALAEMLDAPLLTCDRRLAVAAGHNAQIDLV